MRQSRNVEPSKRKTEAGSERRERGREERKRKKDVDTIHELLRVSRPVHERAICRGSSIRLRRAGEVCMQIAVIDGHTYTRKAISACLYNITETAYSWSGSTSCRCQ